MVEIPRILASGGLNNAQIYEILKERIPECVSNDIFVARGRGYGLRWQHTVREAQQSLKAKGTIQRVEHTWILNKAEAALDLEEQEEIADLIEQNSVEKLRKDLRSVTATASTYEEVNGKRYKRDNVTIEKLKKLRNYKCQICGTTIVKKDGKFYAEGAHITPKKIKGPELPRNIMILCPNHHKEFDLGDLRRIERTEDHFKFILNGRDYTVDLSI